jgi:hypothetical protein
MRPSTASPIYLHACSQRILGVAPAPLARSRRGTATHTARDSNLGSGNHEMSRLSVLAYLNDSPIHGLTDMPLRLLSTDIGCGTLVPRSRRGTATHSARDSDLGSGNHGMSRLSALAYLNDAPIHGLTDKPLAHFQRILGVASSPLALAETRQHTLLATQTSTAATTTCLDYYLHSGT